MIDIRSRYQMMHYLVMDIPFNDGNDLLIKLVKLEPKVSDFAIAYRTLFSHYYKDLFKDISQEDQIEVVLPEMDRFDEYISPYYDEYKSSIIEVLKTLIDDEDFIINISELIGIRSMLIAAASYFKITTGKKSSKIKRLIYLINMITIIYDDTKKEINIDSYDSVNKSLKNLLEAMESYYKE